MSGFKRPNDENLRSVFPPKKRIVAYVKEFLVISRFLEQLKENQGAGGGTTARTFNPNLLGVQIVPVLYETTCLSSDIGNFFF